jgi:hypothetical protein
MKVAVTAMVGVLVAVTAKIDMANRKPSVVLAVLEASNSRQPTVE